MDMSMWRNQDQNENQATTEIEILQTIRHIARVESLERGPGQPLPLDRVILKAQRKNPAKVNETQWANLGRFYNKFLTEDCEGFFEDLADFHAAFVNPRVTTVSMKFYGLLTTERALEGCPNMRMALLMTQYTSPPKHRNEVGATGPAFGSLLEQTAVTSLCKDPAKVLAVEERLKKFKDLYLPILIEGLGERSARLEVNILMTLVIRMLFGKEWLELTPKIPLAVGGGGGKFSIDKIQELLIHWAKTVDYKYPTLDFSLLTGLKEAPKQEDTQEPAELMQVGNLRGLKREISEGGRSCSSP